MRRTPEELADRLLARGFKTASPCGGYEIESWPEGDCAVVVARELKAPHREARITSALDDPEAAGREAADQAVQKCREWGCKSLQGV